MNGLLIVGAGGHGKVVAETAEAAGGFGPIRFLDTDYMRLDGSLRWPVGNPDEYVRPSAEFDAAVVAIGLMERRLALLGALEKAGFELPVICHPTAWVTPSARLGAGTVVFAQAAIQADARLGRGVIVNTSASVDHDCVLADGVHVCPGAHLAGNVTADEGSWLGIGCAVKQGVSIGKGVTVGAGAAVVSDVEDGKTVVGVPARIIKE